MLTGDVAQPDSADQSVVAGRDHDRKLVVEAFVWPVAVDESQIHPRQLVYAKRPQVGFNVLAIVGRVDRQPAAGIVAAGADLADQCQVRRIRVQSLADQFVGHVRPVELGGVDVVDTEFDGPAQHGQRLAAVARRPEDPGPGKLDGSVPDTRDRKATEWKGIHTVRLASSYGHVSSAGSAPRW